MLPVLQYKRCTGFEIDLLLGCKQNILECGAKFLCGGNTGGEALKTMEPGHSGKFQCESSGMPTGNNVIHANHVQSSRDFGFCASCFENGNAQENIFTSIKPYEIPSYNDLMRSGNMTTNTLPLMDNVGIIPSVQTSDIRQSSLGNLGLKLHNNLNHLDSLSNLSNMSSITPGYSTIANLYSPTSHLARVCSPPHVEHSLSGTTLSWTQTRGGGLFTSRCHDTALFMSPYRKPKRIRTAFSPTQLLRLEHAFEKNHYVVGQERKDLASSLNLSETQVKVWFQNRRTKHKRMKAEDDITSSLSRRIHHTGDSNESSPFDNVIIDT